MSNPKAFFEANLGNSDARLFLPSSVDRRFSLVSFWHMKYFVQLVVDCDTDI